MTAPYEGYADPERVPVLDNAALDLSPEGMNTVRTLLVAATPDSVAVRAAHVYDRKGYFATDDFAGNPNPTYRSADDDIVVQVTLVVRKHDLNQDHYDPMIAVYNDVQAAKKAADIAAKQAAVDKAHADLVAAQQRLAEAQAALD